MNISKMFKLNWADLQKGLTVAILAVVLGGLQQAVTAHGLDFTSYDWGGMFDLAWKATGVYLTKNLLSDSSGRVLGRIG